MKRIAGAVCLLLSACGGKEAAQDVISGNWGINIVGVCSGTMAIQLVGESVTGTSACNNAVANVNGTITPSSDAATSGSISFTWSSPGMNNALITGTFTDTAMNGSIDGSGFSGQTFKASKR